MLQKFVKKQDIDWEFIHTAPPILMSYATYFQCHRPWLVSTSMRIVESKAIKSWRRNEGWIGVHVCLCLEIWYHITLWLRLKLAWCSIVRIKMHKPAWKWRLCKWLLISESVTSIKWVVFSFNPIIKLPGNVYGLIGSFFGFDDVICCCGASYKAPVYLSIMSILKTCTSVVWL